MGTHPIFESDFDCLTDKMEERHTFDNYELIVQLVPETGENNFQYVIKDASTNEAIAIDCYDADKALAAIGSAKLVASLGEVKSTSELSKEATLSHTSSLGSYWRY